MVFKDYSLLRKQMTDLIGITPDFVYQPQVKILSTTACDGYTRELMEFKSADDDIITAYLLMPLGEGEFPGIVVYHQHNSQRHLGKSEVCGLAGNPLQAFGVELVKRGLAVLAFDSICFEDRRLGVEGVLPNGNDFLQHYNEMCYRILKGETLMEKVLKDAITAINLLSNNPQINSNKIGILGHSYGGYTAVFHAAIDERIKFTCASGAVCSYKNRMENGTGIEMASVIPNFLNSFDMDDVIRCIAPRKLLVVSADEDKYSLDADSIVDITKAAYREFGKLENLAHKKYSGGHSLTKARFDFIVDYVVASIKTE